MLELHPTSPHYGHPIVVVERIVNRHYAEFDRIDEEGDAVVVMEGDPYASEGIESEVQCGKCWVDLRPEDFGPEAQWIVIE